MWLLVWIFLLKIYFLPIELKMQIAGLSCLHADVCKMSSLQVHQREVILSKMHTDTHILFLSLSLLLFAVADLAKKLRIGIVIQVSQKN